MSNENEVTHAYMNTGQPTAKVNLFGESEVDRENRKLLQEAEAKAKAQAYMSRKDEDISPTERMLRDAAAGQAQASSQKEADHLAYEHHMAQKELKKAQEYARGEPMNEAQWNEVQKQDFKFYLSDAGTAIRKTHQKTLGLMYHSLK